MRGSEFNVEASYQMLVNSLKWRNEFKPHRITVEEIGPVLVCGRGERGERERERKEGERSGRRERERGDREERIVRRGRRWDD